MTRPAWLRNDGTDRPTFAALPSPCSCGPTTNPPTAHAACPLHGTSACVADWLDQNAGDIE